MSIKTTLYTATTNEAVETAWKLKRLTETHEMRQHKLMKEYKAKSEALTDEMQVEQSTVFNELSTSLGVPADDWGDGKDWALDIENLADGSVSLVYDEDPSRKSDDCDCLACQLRRLMTGEEREDEVEPVIH